MIRGWILLLGLAGVVVAGCSEDDPREAQGTAVASQATTTNAEAALNELPDACEILTAEQAAAAMNGEQAVKSAQSRHGAFQSICIYQSSQSGRSLGLAILSFKRRIFDYRNMSTEAFVESIVSAGMAGSGQYTSHDPDVGSGMYEFSEDEQHSVWINSGIRAPSSPASEEMGNEYFLSVTAGGFGEEAKMQNVVRRVAESAQSSLEHRAGQ